VGKKSEKRDTDIVDKLIQPALSTIMILMDRAACGPLLKVKAHLQITADCDWQMIVIFKIEVFS
jgi:hypothetical protein